MQKCEVNGVEVKIGQWWRTRDGGIVYVFGICPIGIYPIACYTQNGNHINLTTAGKWLRSAVETDSDLVEHLPGCTGFDWREFTPEFWYGSEWPECGSGFAYAVRRKQCGPICYVRRDGSEVGHTTAGTPHETWVSITEEQAMDRLSEVDDMDDTDLDDDADDYSEDGVEDDGPGWTSNFGNSEYDESGDDHVVHVSIHIENLNIYVSNLNGISASLDPENTSVEAEPALEPTYRSLGLDEIIEDGDEFLLTKGWCKFVNSVGENLSSSPAHIMATRTKRPPVKIDARSAF